MDAHFFRKLALELFLLEGARAEKIHAPAQDILSILLFLPAPGLMNQRKWRLIMRFGRREPLLFLSQVALPNPSSPPAWVMRLRKYVRDRKFGPPVINWTERALALPFQPSEAILATEKNPPCWLLLDLKEGPKLLRHLPENFTTEAQWPAPEQLENLLTPVVGAEEPWKNYPALTPALRKTMLQMDIHDAQALLIDLEDGAGDIFAYVKAAPENLDTKKTPGPETSGPETSGPETPESATQIAGTLAAVAAWPLQDKRLIPAELAPFYPAIDAARRFGEPLLLAEFGAKLAQVQVNPLKSEEKRLKKLLKKLDEEEKRLRQMCEQHSKALLIQANLYRFDKNSKLARLALTNHLDNPDTEEPKGLTPDPQKRLTLELNPKLTLLENMEKFFKSAERGERGLRFLAERRSLIRQELEASQANLENIPTHNDPARSSALQDKDKGKLSNSNKKEPEHNRLYNAFKSSDGYTMLLGKNAKGNHELMRLALAHDYWLHSEIGQSAHLIIRRKHAADEVPERTLTEAGILVGLKSWQSTDGKANIICALGKDIKPMKGAGTGTARINKLLFSFSVGLDPSLPEHLQSA